MTSLLFLNQRVNVKTNCLLLIFCLKCVVDSNKMAKKQISVDIRKLIVKKHKEGFSKREIGREYSVSEAGVRKIVKKFEELGSVTDRTGRGRKRKTTASDDRMISREAAKNSFSTSRVIRENANLNISDRTVRRRLQEMGYKSGFAQRRPLIRPVNRFVKISFSYYF